MGLPRIPQYLDDVDASLRRLAASFVTLRQGTALRGCIGSLEASRPLIEDVEANAAMAACEDPRFPPLARHELDRTRIEVSVLSPLEAFDVSGETDLLARLRPGEDGLVVVALGRRATFLPHVWRQLPEPRDFLEQLRRKAGLPADFWDLGPRFLRYTATTWGEKDSRRGSTQERPRTSA